MPIKTLPLVLLTSIAPLIWGTTYLVTTELLPANSPLLAGTLRSLPVGLVLVLLSRQLLRRDWWLKAAVLGMLNIGLFFICLFSAAYLLPGGVAAILLATQPLWSIFLAAWLLSEGLTKTSVFRALLGLIGVLLLVGDTSAGLNPLGVAIALLGACSMALGIVLAKKWQSPASLSLMGLSGWQLLFAGLFLLPLALWFEGFPTEINLSEAIGFAYLAIPGTMLSYCLWFYGIQRLPTATVVILGFLSPVSANLLGYFWLSETFSASQSFGLIAIVVTLLLPFIASRLKPLLVSKRPQTT